VLFKGKVNDISFQIGGKLVVLIEHQSTINDNMALRLLLYIARIYDRLIGSEKVYATAQITLPRPEFYVLYNGVASCPDRNTLRLSTAFEELSPLGLAGGSPALELEVTVLNINEGRNGDVAERCKTLAGYQAFVAKVREYQEQGHARKRDLKDALKKAVRYCRNHDILKEFLRHHGTEVIGMLTTEWNWDEALAVRYKEGKEEGREEGREEERLVAARNALAEGLPMETVQKVTGLDPQVIENLK